MQTPMCFLQAPKSITAFFDLGINATKPMKPPRRSAPMGGSLQVEWVATFSGLRTLELVRPKLETMPRQHVFSVAPGHEDLNHHEVGPMNFGPANGKGEPLRCGRQKPPAKLRSDEQEHHMRPSGR
jgi:hypothetical protein